MAKRTIETPLAVAAGATTKAVLNILTVVCVWANFVSTIISTVQSAAIKLYISVIHKQNKGQGQDGCSPTHESWILLWVLSTNGSKCWHALWLVWSHCKTASIYMATVYSWVRSCKSFIRHLTTNLSHFCYVNKICSWTCSLWHPPMKLLPLAEETSPGLWSKSTSVHNQQSLQVGFDLSYLKCMFVFLMAKYSTQRQHRHFCIDRKWSHHTYQPPHKITFSSRKKTLIHAYKHMPKYSKLPL